MPEDVLNNFVRTTFIDRFGNHFPADPEFDGADVINCQLDNLEDAELESVIAEAQYDPAQFGRMVLMYAQQERDARRRRGT